MCIRDRAILCFAQNLPLFIMCGAIFGLGFGFYNPTYNLLIAGTAAKPKFGSQAIAIYTSCVGLGQFLSPCLLYTSLIAASLEGLSASAVPEIRIAFVFFMYSSSMSST